MKYIHTFHNFINESESEVALILSKDEDFERVKKILHTDPKFSKLNFIHWAHGQPLGSVRGHLITMYFLNSKEDILDFIESHDIKVANMTNFK